MSCAAVFAFPSIIAPTQDIEDAAQNKLSALATLEDNIPAPNIPDSTDTTVSGSVSPLDNTISISDKFCAYSPDTYRDRDGRVWSNVSTLTKDGIGITFDISLGYEFHALSDEHMNSECFGIGQHIYALARTAFSEEIMSHNYADLPDHHGTLLLDTIARLNQKMRTILHGNYLDITNVGINNVQAPGLSPHNAIVMLYSGLPETTPLSPAMTTSGASLNFENDLFHVPFHIEYDITSAAYNHYGVDDGQIKNIIYKTVMSAIKTTIAEWNPHCVASDLESIKNSSYLKAEKFLEDRGIYLTALTVSSLTLTSPNTLPNGTSSGLKCLTP